MKDMTKGKPLGVLVSFAVPMVLSSLLQQCYHLADSLVAGRFAGVDALAAVGVSTPIATLFVGLGTGLGMGCGVIISQVYGAKDMKKLKTAIYTGILAVMALSALLTVLGSVFAKDLAIALKTPESIFEDSLSYLRIYMYGLPFLFAYNIANSVFNALGDSKKPLYFLIFSTVLNIGLDILFVKEFAWGVQGTAWATFLAQGLAAVLAMGVLLGKTRKAGDKAPLFQMTILEGMFKVGIPTMLQNAIISVGNLFVSRLVNTYGPQFIAGYNAGTKINGIFTVVIFTLGSALATFTAQNVGAGDLKRPVQGLRACLIINFLYVGLATVITFLFGHQLVGLFADESATAEFFEAGTGYLKVVVLGSFLFILLNNCCALCRGAGFVFASTSTTLVDLIVRVTTAYALTGVLQGRSLYWSVSIGWTVGAVMGILFYFSGKWKNIDLLKSRKAGQKAGQKAGPQDPPEGASEE